MLNVGKILNSSIANGPGIRSVIWLQGCSILCKNCWNPSFLSNKKENFQSINKIMHELTKDASIEGVSILGGEPFDQPEGLLELVKSIKNIGLTVVLWSGFEKSVIEKLIPQGREILSSVDILIDGPYMPSEKANLLWRGSKNQKVYFQSDIYKTYMDRVFEDSREFEIQFINGSIVLTGDPSEELINIFHTAVNKILLKGSIIE